MMFFRSGHGLYQIGRRRLHGLDAVTQTLMKIAEQPGGMSYLRGALGGELPKSTLDELSNAEVLMRLAAAVMSGAIAFVALRPRDAPAEGFLVEGAAATALAGGQNEAGDLKPSPEVPREYPILARAESDQIIDSASKLGAALAALAFGMWKREVRQSTIARTYTLVAGEEGARIASTKTQVDIALEVGLWRGGGLAQPKPAVPVEFKVTAKTTGESTKSAIDKLGSSVAALFRPEPFVRRRSEAREGGG